jgi:hypothetical protein
MTIFETLLMAHLVGDWLVQTEWQAANKVHNWRAMLSHVIVYHIIVLGVLVAWFGFRDMYVYAVVVILAVTHAVLDRQGPVEWFMRTFRLCVNRKSERWLVIVVDQSIHIVLLGLAALFLSRRGGL